MSPPVPATLNPTNTRSARFSLPARPVAHPVARVVGSVESPATDWTLVATRTGTAYVCVIIDAFSRMIVGWRVASHMRTSMVLRAIEMARRCRGARISGLTVHSDAGSQFGAVHYSERLADLDAAPSVGSVGDSYDHDVMAGSSGRV